MPPADKPAGRGGNLMYISLCYFLVAKSNTKTTSDENLALQVKFPAYRQAGNKTFKLAPLRQ